MRNFFDFCVNTARLHQMNEFSEGTFIVIYNHISEKDKTHYVFYVACTLYKNKVFYLMLASLISIESTNTFL